jgi:MFS family permease
MQQNALRADRLRSVVAAFLALACAMGVGRFALTPLLPLMQQDAGEAVSAGTWLGCANYLGYFLGAGLAYRLPCVPGTAIRWALAATAVSTFAMGVTADPVAWILLRGVSGVASAFLLVFVASWSFDRMGADAWLRATVFSGVGGGIFAVGAACLAFSLWRLQASLAWMVLGALCFVLTAFLWPRFRSTVPRQFAHSSLPEPRHDHAHAPGTSRALLAYTAVGFGYILPATFLPMMAAAHGVAPGRMLIAWPLFGLAALVSTYFAVALGRADPPLVTWRRAQWTMAAAVAAPACWPGFGAVVLAGLGVGGTFMVITMAAMQAARHLAAGAPHRLMAAMTMGFAAGQLAGPALVPFLVGRQGDFSAALLAAAAALSAGALLLPRSAPAALDSFARKEH